MADLNPGDGDAKRLKRYWLTGPGRAKWSSWTELYHHLRKYIHPDDFAKRTAAQWYHEGTGLWAGSDMNRVVHGKPPRGNRIGPG